MHEQSLVKGLLKQVDQIRCQNNAQRVVNICVEWGPLSGVEPALLMSAFEQLCCDDSMKSASLVIEQVDLLAKCVACGNEFEVCDFNFHCPNCGGNVNVIRGDEIQLVSVSLESTELETQEK